MKNKTAKIVIAIIILLLGILISNNVKAAAKYVFTHKNQYGYYDKYLVVSDGAPFNDSNTDTADGQLPDQITMNNKNHWIFCIWKNKAYKATYDYKYAEGDIYNKNGKAFCTLEDGDDNRPFTEQYSMEYKFLEKVSYKDWQDVAYILTFADPKYDRAVAQTAIWSTPINQGTKLTSDLANEAAAYKSFYQSIHDANGSTFKSKIKDNTGNPEIIVNSDNSYTVGPFNFSYAAGVYNGKNKFSWIDNIIAATDVGNIDLSNGLTILASDKTTVLNGKLGKDGTESLSGKSFYIKFKNTSAKKFTLKVDFGYLESCFAEMEKYEGYLVYWRWNKISWYCKDGKTYAGTTYAAHHHYEHEYDLKHPEGHQVVKIKHPEGHEEKCGKALGPDLGWNQMYWTCGSSGHPGYYVWELPKNGLCGHTIKKACTHTEIIIDTCTEHIACKHEIDTATSYIYQLYRKNGDPTQTTLHLVGNAYANYGDEIVTIGKEIILTKELSGKVFIDNDGGKVNEGNNKYDSGEGLSPVDVRLYDASNNSLVAVTNTDQYGGYKFEGLSRFKTYYVRFSYNGMIYTNVATGTEANSSKATETAQNHGNNRINFNSKFAEIGSYPANYKTTDILTGAIITNKTYLQEDIVELYQKVVKEIVKNGGNEKAAYQTVISNNSSINDIKNKVQFIADCTINAYTVESYKMTTDISNVNLGIKARPTFDLALYKDVLKAQVSINGKTETYYYDARKQSGDFSLGITENFYSTSMRTAYINGKNFTNNAQTREVETDTYQLNMRETDIVNGGTSYNLTDAEKLQILVTYKIAIRNQSNILGSVTEVVDYYDTNYKFVEAYVGDVKGNKTGEVTKHDTSMYGNEYKSTKNSYNTMYLRATTQTNIASAQEQYIYVVLELNNASEVLNSKLIQNKDTLNALNLAEINGYKTGEGLIDIDSNPGNLNISNIAALTQDNLINYPNIRSMYEDDTSRAPVVIYKLFDSRTIEGTVFEDNTGKTNKVYTNQIRVGNGKLDDKDIGIAGVKVELIEVKNNQQTVRLTTKTDKNGKYIFKDFLPGDYIIRYTYGSDDDTAMTKASVYYKGLNDKSYNGQDYRSTTYAQQTGDYWYTTQNGLSDATDNKDRDNAIISYARTENGTAIVNHKAEVFSAYENPQGSHITKEVNRQLANELESKMYRYADTPKMVVEIEYATKETTGTQIHEYKITGVDFGIVERAKSELTIDQDVKHIKVTAADGNTILFDTETGTNNLQWIGKGDISKYDTKELINIIMDDELISGSKLEITYYLTVTNNSEKDGNATTIAKNILNYVSNNLNFDVEDNKDTSGRALWEVVAKDAVQTGNVKTYVNSAVDLSTQAIILKATNTNPLVTTNLRPGEQVTTTLKLKKVLSAESATDDLSYTNLAEIVEIDNGVGRYDHGAIPGNQQIGEVPQEHDATGVNNDGKVIVTPPTGSQYIYYVIGITSAMILLAGIYFIRKFVVKKK